MVAPDAPLVLTRINNDSSWLLELDGTRLLLDPWLGGPAIVGLPAIHQADLGEPAVPLAELPPWDALVISHPFPDHCQEDTLRALPKDRPAFVPIVAWPRTKRLGRFPDLTVLGNATRGAPARVVGDVEISYCRAANPFDPTHNALVFRGRQSGCSVVYCPHGLLPATRTLDAVEQRAGGHVDALLCSFTFLDLPFYLGGIANLGVEHGTALVKHLQPRYAFGTHDAPKPDSGFIARIEKLVHPGPLAGLLTDAGAEARTEHLPVGQRWIAA